jgi:hypothetical protein
MISKSESLPITIETKHFVLLNSSSSHSQNDYEDEQKSRPQFKPTVP